MNYRIIKLNVLMLFVTTLAVAQSKQYNFSLQESIDYAMQNQSSIKNAEINVDISKAKVRETVAIGLPQVNGIASFQKFLDVPTQVIPNFISPLIDTTGNYPPYIAAQFGTNYNLSYGVEASQLIFDGNYLVGLQASNVYQDLSRKSLTRTKIEASVSVTKAYYSVLINQKRLELLDANIIQLKKTLDDTKAYYTNGFAEKIDADRLSVLYNNLVTEQQSVKRLIELNVYLLKFQMGMPLTDELTLKDNFESIQLQDASIETAPVNPENRVEYSLVKTQMKLNELDYRRNILTRAPSLVAFGSYTKNGQENDFSKLTDKMYTTSLVGMKLTIPIIGSGQKYYQTQQAKLSLEKSKNDLKTLENGINLEARTATTMYNNSLSSLENQRKNMDLAKEVLRVSKAKYEQGVGSSLEVTTAQTSLKEAETNYIGSLYDAIIAKVDLDKAYGRIK